MVPRFRRSGFTLIELLTVIAIIAILAAILFPVVAAVREQARQGSCMSNLHQIYVAAQVYRQDEGAFPPVLQGYAEQSLICNPQRSSGIPYNAAADTCPGGSGVVNADRILYGFLYKEQVKDINVLRCPTNNPVQKGLATVAHFPPHPPNWPVDPLRRAYWYVGDSGEITNWCPSDAAGYIDCFREPEVACRGANPSPLCGQPKYFYVWNSYDIGPRIGPDGKLARVNGQIVYDRHYSPDWTGAQGLEDLTVQLKYQNPPSDKTILTYCTWHVAVAGSSSVPAINMAGSARKLDSVEVYKHGANIFNK